jgi:hypothetical protein
MFCVHVTYQGGFHGKTDEDQTAIQGYGGVEVYDVYKGTLKWKIEDEGRHHTIYIPSHTTSQRVMHDSLVPSTGLNKLTRKDRIWTKHAILTELSAGHFMTERH